MRLGIRARATRDIDTLFRGNFEEYLRELDKALHEPFAGITFQRTRPTPVQIPGRTVNPMRLQISLLLQGRVWRKVSLEVAPDEARASSRPEAVAFPSLRHFGLPSPESAYGISIADQIAQKFHACTDPHTEEHPNYRVRDVIDLLLLKREYFPLKRVLEELRTACEDVFSARSYSRRTWPPRIEAHSHWEVDYQGYSAETGIVQSLSDAVDELNEWIDEIANSGH